MKFTDTLGAISNLMHLARALHISGKKVASNQIYKKKSALYLEIYNRSFLLSHQSCFREITYAVSLHKIITTDMLLLPSDVSRVNGCNHCLVAFEISA